MHLIVEIAPCLFMLAGVACSVSDMASFLMFMTKKRKDMHLFPASLFFAGLFFRLERANTNMRTAVVIAVVLDPAVWALGLGLVTFLFRLAFKTFRVPSERKRTTRNE